jgi:hypothetical protein
MKLRLARAGLYVARTSGLVSVRQIVASSNKEAQLQPFGKRYAQWPVRANL